MITYLDGKKTSDEIAMMDGGPPLTHSLFIVSYLGDIEWLKMCLKSVTRNATGFDEVVVAVPQHELPVFQKLGLTRERLIPRPTPCHDDYMGQQWVKMHSPLYCRGKWITHIDSDCIIHSTWDAEECMSLTGEQAVLLKTPYDKCPGSPWRPFTEEALGIPCPYETMRRHGATYHHTTYPLVCNAIEGRHNKPLARYLNDCKARGFSEFNAIGSYLIHNNDPHYLWIDTSVDPIPTSPMYQYWSWGKQVLTLIRGGATNEQVNAVIKAAHKFEYDVEMLNELRKWM